VLLITAGAIFLGELTDGQESRVIVNLGLELDAAFRDVYRDIRRVSLRFKGKLRNARFIDISKPIGRSEFIVGKFFSASA